MYRVSRQVLPKLDAVESADSSAIRFENVHTFSMTRLAFDNSIYDDTSGVRVRDHEFATFTIGPNLKPGSPLPLPAGVFAPDAKLEHLAGGFSNADGLTADDTGNVYFTDAIAHSVHCWNVKTNQESILTYSVNSPMAAAYAGHGTLLVVDLSRTVYAVNAKTGATTKVVPAGAPVSGTNLLLPVGVLFGMRTLKMQVERRGVVYAPRSNMAITAVVTNQPRSWFYAPGATSAILAGGDWRPLLQASQWRLFHVGDEHFAISEDDGELYRVRLDSLDHLTATKFAPRGGTSVVADSAGNVYVAAGQLYVYNHAGKQIGVVEIPQRPGSLVFAGPDKRTLFIGARNSLFSLRTRAAGK
jgi:hypothetical protein